MSETQPLVSQPSWMPSRKIMVGALAGVITAGVTQWTTKFATQYPDALAFLDSGAWKAFVPLGAMFAAGYVFRDRATTSVKASTQPTTKKGKKNA